ncbi:MAG: SbcC/MukB-like Walker B domain-containing protein [Ferrovibrio sp.]|uniref:SbcC/MukB-like Walker B domain-containing protein n=1 Tax=Ferrovibrio sp. TaxID=1917215 RepID=UPI003918EE8D
MYRLESISLVNWYLFNPIDIPISGHTVILGENGSGKTSILDAIQTAILGNDGRFLSLNARHEQKRGPNKRTVKSYMLGIADDAEPRDSAYTYITLGFRNDFLEQEVTIGVALSVSANQDDETIEQLFIVPGRILTKDDLCVISDGIATPIRWPDLKRALVDEGLEPIGDTRPTRFRKAYMEILNPGSRGFSSVDDDRFVRIFRQTLEFKVENIVDVTSFMRKFVLPDRELPLDDWRNQYRSLNEYVQRINIVETEISAIRAVQTAAVNLRSAEVGLMAANWATERLPHLTQIRKYRDAMRKLGIEKARKIELGGVLEGLNRRKNDAEQRRNELDKIFSSSSEQVGILKAEHLADGVRTTLNETEVKIAQFRNAFAGIPRVVRDVGEIVREAEKKGQARLVSELAASLRVAENASADLAVAGAGTGHDWIEGREGYHAALKRLKTSPFRSALQAFRDDIVSRTAPSKKELEELRGRLASVGGGRSPLPGDTRELIDELRSHGISATTISAEADIRPGFEDWRGIAEAILGDWCHAIIVPPADVEKAIGVIRRGRRNEPLLRTNKTPAMIVEPDSKSLAYVVESKNPHAAAYIRQTLGNIERVASEAQLASVERGATTDGMFSSGYGVRRRWMKSLPELFGRSQTGLADALRERIGVLEQEIRESSADIIRAEKLLSNLDQYVRAIPDTLGDYLQPFEERSRLKNRLEELTDSIKKLQDKVDPEIASEMAHIRRNLDDLEDEIRLAQDDHQKAHDQTISLGKDAESARQNREERRNTLVGLRAGWKASGVHVSILVEGLALIRALQEKPGAINELLNEHRKKASGRKNRSNGLLGEARGNYVKLFPQKFVPDIIGEDIFEVTGRLADWSRDRIQTLENDELLPYREKAAAAQEMWLEKTRTDFMQQMRGLLHELSLIKSRLSGNMERRMFNRSVYKISMEAEPDMRAVIDLANNIEHRGHKFTQSYIDANPADPDVVAIGTLMTMLTGNTAGSEALTRFTDYRNYYTFDISIHDPVTGKEKSRFTKRVASASGGERDVPFYICLGVAMAMTYFGRLDEEEMSRKSGVVLLDEAFNNLDPGNVAKIIEYFRSIGLQIVCAAPSTNRAVYTQVMRRVINITKVGDCVELLPAKITQKANDLVRRANPSITDEGGLHA